MKVECWSCNEEFEWDDVIIERERVVHKLIGRLTNLAVSTVQLDEVDDLVNAVREFSKDSVAPWDSLELLPHCFNDAVYATSGLCTALLHKLWEYRRCPKCREGL